VTKNRSLSRIDNHWLLHGAMSTPGAIIKWLGEELALSRKVDKGVYDLIFEEARESPPGENGLIFLPYMFGERTPIWDPNARGVLFGLSLTSKQGDIYRSILEKYVWVTNSGDIPGDFYLSPEIPCSGIDSRPGKG